MRRAILHLLWWALVAFALSGCNRTGWDVTCEISRTQPSDQEVQAVVVRPDKSETYLATGQKKLSFRYKSLDPQKATGFITVPSGDGRMAVAFEDDGKLSMLQIRNLRGGRLRYVLSDYEAKVPSRKLRLYLQIVE